MCKGMTLIIGTLLIMGMGTYAQAGIVLNTTRVVYPAQDKEVMLSVQNRNASAILLQSWLESEESGMEELPFAVVPPLAPLPGGGRQTVRIIHSGVEMPLDRESLFWLSVQEIPQAAVEENVLQIGIRQRIKVFYRPRNLQGDADEAPAQLRWSLSPNGVLAVANSTPYHVTMVDIEVLSGGARLLHRKNAMLTPGQTLSFELEEHITEPRATVSFKSINDHGAVVPYRLSGRDWKIGRASLVER